MFFTRRKPEEDNEIYTMKLVDGKSTMVAPEKCDSEGRCVSACPQKAIPHLEDQKY